MPGAVSVMQNVHQLRRLVPVRLVPAVVQRRLDKLWENDAFVASQVDQMEFLLSETERAGEVEELARGYTEQMLIRGHMRWHPRAITHQRVKGIEQLTTARDPRRSIILSFLHHHRYDGLFASLTNAGAPRSRIVIAPAIARPEAGIVFAQHLRVANRGGDFVMAEGGTEALAAVLKPGVIMALAPDFPGRTPVMFLDKLVLGSFGTPRLAMMTDSQVVLVTHRRDAQGPYIQVHEPLEPKDFADPGDLLDEILRRHGEAVLDWPEAFESPRARFGKIADQ